MTTEPENPLATAESHLAAGDVPALIRHLRLHGDELPLAEIARLVGAAARLAGFTDLAEAADAFTPGDTKALFDFGYACIDRGIDFLGIRPMREALALEPGVMVIRTELVVALEAEGRHAEAVAVLTEPGVELTWLARFQLIFNALAAGTFETAAVAFHDLPLPEDPSWIPMREKVRWMLARGTDTSLVSDLGDQDLRTWHYILTGGILTGISPYGFTAGMTGRWAYVSDSYSACAEALRRLELVLSATGRKPQSVSLLPDHSSAILGLAAARLLNLPTVPFAPDRADTLVVAYNLNDVEPPILAALHDRTPGQILFERATCWTDPPRVAADVCGLLAQTTVTPWGRTMRVDPETRKTETVPADVRPVEEIAAQLAATTPHADLGDGETPPDPDAELVNWLGVTGATWLGARREYVRVSGPVRSSRFM